MVAEHVFAVGNAPSTKEMVGVVSKPKVGVHQHQSQTLKHPPELLWPPCLKKKKIYKLIQY